MGKSLFKESSFFVNIPLFVKYAILRVKFITQKQL